MRISFRFVPSGRTEEGICRSPVSDVIMPDFVECSVTTDGMVLTSGPKIETCPFSSKGGFTYMSVRNPYTLCYIIVHFRYQAPTTS